MAIARHKTRQRELREERALTRRVQRGDRKAFELLYAAHEGRLYRFCYRLTGSEVSAAALVEATFSRALADLPEDGLDRLDVSGYLYATARGLAYERSANGGPPPAARGGEGVREVAAAHGRLAPRQRMALVLRDLEGRPDDEIAVALGSDEVTVAALVARARLRLRAELQLPPAIAPCDTRLRELSAYSDGTLAPGARAPLETHLEGCAHCRAALFALREAGQRYRSLPVPTPPGELSARLAAALDAVGLAKLSPPGAPPTSAYAATGGRQTAAAVAMAALVIVGAAVTIAAWQSGDETTSHAPAPVPAPSAHADASPGAGSLASLAAGGRQVVALRANPVPPALHHLRTGPHAALTPPPAPPPNAAAIALPSAPATPPAGAAAPRAKPAPQPPRVQVEIVKPGAPSQAASPASATEPPAPIGKPPPEQTTTT